MPGGPERKHGKRLGLKGCQAKDEARLAAKIKRKSPEEAPVKKPLVSRNEIGLDPLYRQSARALAVHCPKPLAIMLRMTEQT
jgi:hypothetical protein